jgi:hypothetical protein
MLQPCPALTPMCIPGDVPAAESPRGAPAVCNLIPRTRSRHNAHNEAVRGIYQQPLLQFVQDVTVPGVGKL